MALPPSALGNPVRTVCVESIEDQQWRVSVDGVSLPRTFTSEREASDAATAEVVRADAVARALLRRVRAGLNRKRWR